MSVYVIECAGLLKIGYSQTPEQRARNLFKSTSRYAAPRAAYDARGTQRLLHVIDGATKQDERSVHSALDDYSIGCEWFVNEPAVIDLVRSFQIDDLPSPLARPEGPAWKTMPRSEQGGGNAELAMELLAKRGGRLAPDAGDYERPDADDEAAVYTGGAS
jgi:hypothetical protein